MYAKSKVIRPVNMVDICASSVVDFPKADNLDQCINDIIVSWRFYQVNYLILHDFWSVDCF